MVKLYFVFTVTWCALFLCFSLPRVRGKVCTAQITVRRWRVVNEFSPETSYWCGYDNDGEHKCEQRTQKTHKTRRQPYTALETQYFCCPGYYEDPYGNCKACPPGRYGMDCKNQCSCPETAYELCNHVNGSCTCTSGWTGAACQSTCQSGTYGADCSEKCACPDNSYSTCHHATGECTCTPGWRGVNCDEECEPGFYGLDCLSACSCPDTAFPVCDHETGQCQCHEGWIGEQCDQQCLAGYFGANCQKQCTCQNGGSCDHVTGACQCAAGWYGPQCESPCPRGTYGPGCRHKCHCLDAISCSRVDGACRCLPGIKGEKCDQGCSPWTYGSTCSLPCACERNTTVVCSPVNGTCLCLFGWKGGRCDVQEPPTRHEQAEPQTNLPLVVGVSAATVSFLAVAVCLLIIVLRRSRHKPYTGWLLPLKTAFCRSMLSNSVVLEPNRNSISSSHPGQSSSHPGQSSSHPDDTRLCSDEAQLPISQICGIGIENDSYSHGDDVTASNTTVTSCDKANPAEYGATDGYDQLRRNTSAQVMGAGSRKPYDHVNRQNLTKSAPVLDEQFYDVTTTNGETQKKRPSSTYQSLAV
ncbi:multiple epidermal growth factor-like domains protein 11 isoform X2 [Gigantopelta aegis]|uniref:multiple epidermal growth factor-like domains protein 11 isoform X2 n=1 Tax=Gigantopelta aegis TaxID=1735272 RepID=UPI001B88CE99|nr:multiple epidermal growth factor-like domains protein 11 isoform X2 [Gigantopelta aegis]